jgi:hypothetical protein
LEFNSVNLNLLAYSKNKEIKKKKTRLKTGYSLILQKKILNSRRDLLATMYITEKLRKIEMNWAMAVINTK